MAAECQFWAIPVDIDHPDQAIGRLHFLWLAIRAHANKGILPSSFFVIGRHMRLNLGARALIELGRLSAQIPNMEMVAVAEFCRLIPFVARQEEAKRRGDR